MYFSLLSHSESIRAQYVNERNLVIFTWIHLVRRMCTLPRLRHLNNPWCYRIWNECKWDRMRCFTTCACEDWREENQIAQLIVPPLRWNARFIRTLKFIWMAIGASGRIFAFIFIVWIGIDVTVECGRQHFRRCHNVCTSLQNSCRAQKKNYGENQLHGIEREENWKQKYICKFVCTA